MKYNFQDILNSDMYDNTRVMFLLGKYNIFINIVADEFKARCTEGNIVNVKNTVAEEFGFKDSSEDVASTSVDINTFFEVIGVPNINGKWYCKTELDTLNKKQKDQILRYIRDPSPNGVLVLTSTNWIVYKDYINNRVLNGSKSSSLIQLTFPNKFVLKDIVKQLFQSRGINISSEAADFFILRLNKSYDEYEDIIEYIRNSHESADLNISDIKVYLKGIERFDIDDFIEELVKPLANDIPNNKRIFKMLTSLEDELGAKNIVYQLLKRVDEMIEYRLLINSGVIPIGINYFFKDVINQLGGEQGKYGKVKEYTFRKKANLASQTSLRDWQYIKMFLTKAIENNRVSEEELDKKCQIALYEICNRSILTESRINNIIGIYNILNNDIDKLNSIKTTI